MLFTLSQIYKYSRLKAFIQDTRVSVMVTPNMDEWELQIRDVRKEDEGKYECQVNTNPLSQMVATLSVTSMN